MNADTEAKLYLQNHARMERVTSLIAELRDLGFENVLRRLGEPINIDARHPQFLQVAAAQQAESAGWYKALDAVFNFPEVVGGIDADTTVEAEYGARSVAAERTGYSEEELSK